MEVIIITLLQYIRENSTQQTNVQIATTLLHHIHNLNEPSLDELANLCHCSPSTFSRFLKTVGLINYRHFCLLLSQPKLVYHHDNFEINHYKSTILNNLQSFSPSKEEILKIAHALHQANKIVFVAFPTHQALTLDFQCKMMMEGKYIDVPALSEITEVLSTLTQNDLILYLSFSGKENSYTQLPKHIPTILITLQKPNASSYQQVLTCGTTNKLGEENFTLMYLLDCIYQTYHELYQDVRF